MAVSSEVATIYNCKSPLENFSASCALGLADELGLFSSMPRALAKRTRMEIIELVLATDMSAHFGIISKFGGFVASSKGIQNTISQHDETGKSFVKFVNESSDTRMLILKVAMKLSDLGHCFLPWEEHMAWCKRLEAEFFTQGDAEMKESLEVSPLMDRRALGVCDHGNSVGFFQMFVIPMLKLWVELFPRCKPILKQFRDNLEQHRQLSMRGEREEVSTAAA